MSYLYPIRKQLLIYTALTCLIAVSVGCSSVTSKHEHTIAPLKTNADELSPERALAQTETINPLTLTAEMRDLVDRHLRDYPSQRSKLRALHELILSNALLNVSYRGDYTGTAIEAFERREANCLSFSHLFIAMARHAGIPAYYQQAYLKPEWQSAGDFLLVRKHVNVTGTLNNHTDYTVDIDKRGLRLVERAHRLTDAEALAQHYNNLSVNALADGQTERAYGLLVRAIKLAPDTDFLWSNLGYLYRTNKQFDDAHDSYATALILNRKAYSAMQNMVNLNEYTGDIIEADSYRQQLRAYRKANPYHHANLSLQAAFKKDWQNALRHINRAIRLKPDELEFQLAKLGYELVLEDYDAAKQTLAAVNGMSLTPYQRKQLREQLETWNYQEVLPEKNGH